MCLIQYRNYNIDTDPACLLRRRVWSFRDVTARARVERALRESEERYRAFIAHTSEGVYRIEHQPPVPANLPIAEQIRAQYATGVLAAWVEMRPKFVKVMPKDYRRVLRAEAEARAEGREPTFAELVGATSG